MWEEIAERELPSAKGFVIFWSANYIVSAGTLRELHQASKLFEEGLLDHVIVIRLDNYPIMFEGGMDVALKPAFDALKLFLKYRTSSPNITPSDLNYMIEKFCETVVPNAHPILPRPELIKEFSDRCRRDNFTCFPAMWMSGLN